jgi:GTPase
MKFIDIAEVRVKAGDGGLGMSHFRRERYVPFGGPDGGNGGRGGNIVLEGSNGLGTLLDFRYNRYHEAEDGGKGGTNNRVGKCASDKVLKVPCGTIVYDADTSEVIGEILENGETLVVALGGKGGIGNALFASSRNQAPLKTIPPEPGERKSLRLELKMIADVGIVGSPNAGKSTLITVISSATPKVADYPFTTLVPNLGVVSHKDCDPFVVADVPGLIPGASEGKGLGYEFLRHVERCRVLLHLVDGSAESFATLKSDFEGIIRELELYNAELLKRPRLTIISKIDSAAQASEDETETPLEQFRAYLKSIHTPWLEVSSATRQGLSAMLDEVVAKLTTTNEGKDS